MKKTKNPFSNNRLINNSFVKCSSKFSHPTLCLKYFLQILKRLSSSNLSPLETKWLLTIRSTSVVLLITLKGKKSSPCWLIWWMKLCQEVPFCLKIIVRLNSSKEIIMIPTDWQFLSLMAKYSGRLADECSMTLATTETLNSIRSSPKPSTSIGLLLLSQLLWRLTDCNFFQHFWET